MTPSAACHGALRCIIVEQMLMTERPFWVCVSVDVRVYLSFLYFHFDRDRGVCSTHPTAG